MHGFWHAKQIASLVLVTSLKVFACDICLLKQMPRQKKKRDSLRTCHSVKPALGERKLVCKVSAAHSNIRCHIILFTHMANSTQMLSSHRPHEQTLVPDKYDWRLYTHGYYFIRTGVRNSIVWSMSICFACVAQIQSPYLCIIGQLDVFCAACIRDRVARASAIILLMFARCTDVAAIIFTVYLCCK